MINKNFPPCLLMILQDLKPKSLTNLSELNSLCSKESQFIDHTLTTVKISRCFHCFSVYEARYQRTINLPRVKHHLPRSKADSVKSLKSIFILLSDTCIFCGYSGYDSPCYHAIVCLQVSIRWECYKQKHLEYSFLVLVKYPDV